MSIKNLGSLAMLMRSLKTAASSQRKEMNQFTLVKQRYTSYRANPAVISSRVPARPEENDEVRRAAAAVLAFSCIRYI